MSRNWLIDDDDDHAAIGGSSFMDRARNAPDDDDEPMRDADAGLGAFNLMLEEDAEETQLQQLVRHWMNERHAPDILPAQEILLGSLLDHIRRQSETVQLLRGDPDSSEDEHFRIMLAQTEIERVKFVVRSYVRTRLFKIEKYARWIVATPEIHERLSESELRHAAKFAQLTESHFMSSVLQGLPEQQRDLTEAPAFMPPMISEPDKTRAVFAHARVKCQPVQLPDGSNMEMEKGQISLTPYVVVEQLLLRGEVELV